MSYADKCDTCGKGLAEPGSVHTCKPPNDSNEQEFREWFEMAKGVVLLEPQHWSDDIRDLYDGWQAATARAVRICEDEDCYRIAAKIGGDDE